MSQNSAEVYDNDFGTKSVPKSVNASMSPLSQGVDTGQSYFLAQFGSSGTGRYKLKF